MYRERTSMNPRRYKTAYAIAKTMEVLSWMIMIIGICTSIIIAFDTSFWVAIGGSLMAIIFGVMSMFSAQLTLIFIDTENNTRQMETELKETREVFIETMGILISKLTKITKELEK